MTTKGKCKICKKKAIINANTITLAILVVAKKVKKSMAGLKKSVAKLGFSGDQ